MSGYAEDINQARSQLFEEVLTILKGTIVEKFSPAIDLEKLNISYSSGWKRGESLLVALQAGRVIDLERGFTHSGPHRADFKLLIDGIPVREYLSRGEKNYYKFY